MKLPYDTLPESVPQAPFAVGDARRRQYFRNMYGSPLPGEALASLGDFWGSSQTGFNANSAPAGGDSWAWMKDSITQVVTAWNAQQIAQINVERARQGLPPLNASQYAPSVNVGLTPEVQTIVLAVAAFALVAMFAKRRTKR